MAKSPSVYELLAQTFNESDPLYDNMIFPKAYKSLRYTKPGDEYSNNNADDSVLEEMRNTTTNNIKFFDQNRWFWHYYPDPNKHNNPPKKVKERISLNVYPSLDLIKDLDAILQKDHGEHIKNYKTPQDLKDWSKRHDPITIYCYSLTPELLAEINTVASKYTRKSKEIEKVETQNPYNVDLADGVYYNTEVKPEEGLALYTRLKEICPNLWENAVIYSYSKNHDLGYMSKGQYVVLKKWTDAIEDAVKTHKIQGEAMAYYMLNICEGFGDEGYDSAKYEKSNPEYGKNMQELADMLKQNGKDEEYLKFLEKFHYPTEDIKKFLNLSKSEPKKKDEEKPAPTAELKEETNSPENMPQAEMSENTTSMHPMNFLIQEFDAKLAESPELENRVQITPDSKPTDMATFNGQEYRIGDNSSLAYTWENSGLKGTDTISAKENNGKGGCDFTISHPQKDVVSNDSIRATIDATVNYMNNQYKDNDDYKGFTFSINPKTEAFRYSVAQELFKYTEAYANKNAETASFYAKQLESIKNFKISGVEIDKNDLLQYKNAAELNEFLTQKIKEARKVEKERQAALKQALEQSRS